MSVINQVLKNLDAQGAHVHAPAGVVAVNRHAVALPRWRLGLAAVALIAVSFAGWWFWPSAPQQFAVPQHRPPTAPQLRMSQQLGALESSETGQKSEAPAIARPAHPADNASSSTVQLPAEHAPGLGAASPAVAKPVLHKPDADVLLRPRLDTRLPEPRPRLKSPPEFGGTAAETRAAIVKEVKPLTPQVQAEEAWRQAGRLLEQGRNHDAQERLEQVLRLDPEHVAARQSLIALALDANDAARGERLLREGLALHPHDPWYPRSLAQLQLQRGDLAQAAGILKTSLAKRSDAANWALYAGTLNKLGKPGDAASAYREALRLDPAQGNWWVGMAVALEQGGETAAASAAYQRALQTRLGAEMREFAQQKARALGER